MKLLPLAQKASNPFNNKQFHQQPWWVFHVAHVLPAGFITEVTASTFVASFGSILGVLPSVFVSHVVTLLPL